MACYTTMEAKSGRWLVLDEQQQAIISTDTEEDALLWIQAAIDDETPAGGSAGARRAHV